MANIFNDKLVKPDDQRIKKALDDNYKCWKELRTSLDKEYGDLKEEWKFYGQKLGWTLKLFYKKRNLFFSSVYDGYFVISFVYGDKAVAVIKESDLPDGIISELMNAKKYAEGRGLRIEVRKEDDVKTILKLVKIKIKA